MGLPSRADEISIGAGDVSPTRNRMVAMAKHNMRLRVAFTVPAKFNRNFSNPVVRHSCPAPHSVRVGTQSLRIANLYTILKEEISIMRITKKILSLLLVVSMIASFFSMTGFSFGAFFSFAGFSFGDFLLHNRQPVEDIAFG